MERNILQIWEYEERKDVFNNLNTRVKSNLKFSYFEEYGKLRGCTHWNGQVDELARQTETTLVQQTSIE